MLKKRIIQTILWDGFQCVKPISFQRPYRKLGAMESFVQVCEKRNLDELIIIDIEATPQKRRPNYVKLRQFCDNLYCPVTYGGGIRTLDDISMALNNGADKVCIKTKGKIIKEASRKFGSQTIVSVLDARMKEGLEYISELAIIEEEQGAGEILLTDVNLDGTMKGYNLKLIDYVSNSVKIPVIANGGCGSIDDMRLAFEAGASAVAAGSLFLFTDETPKSCANHLNEMGYAVRIVS